MAKAKQYTVTVQVAEATALERFDQLRAAFSGDKMTGMSTGDGVRLHFAKQPEAADLAALRALFDGATVLLDSEEVEDDPDVHQRGLLTATLAGFRADTVRAVLAAGAQQADGGVLITDPAAWLNAADDEAQDAIERVVVEILNIAGAMQSIKGAKQ